MLLWSSSVSSSVRAAATAAAAAHARCSSSSTASLESFVAHVTSDAQQPQWRRASAAGDDATFVHPTAVVHPRARLGRDVHVGPYSVVGPDVELGDGVFLKAHVIVDGCTTIGSRTVVHPFASLGGEPQDKKHRSGEPSALVVGRDCVIREHATVHGSTSYSGGTPTRVGDGCWLLCGAHVGHDCDVGARVVLSNNVCVAGHVTIGAGAIVGGQAGLKQHVTVGRLAMVGGMSAVDGDVLPYGLVVGNRAKLAGLNLVGLRRSKVSRQDIKLMLRVYRYLFGVASSCAKTGFAPALDLAPRESIVLRAEEAKQFLLEQQLHHSMVHEMVDFALDAPSRLRSSMCPAVLPAPPSASVGRP